MLYVHTKTGKALYSQETIHSINHLLLRATTLMCSRLFLSVIYISLMSSYCKHHCTWNSESVVDSTFLYELCELRENFLKKCVKSIHLLFIDLHMPLTLDDHSCIRLNAGDRPFGVLDSCPTCLLSSVLLVLLSFPGIFVDSADALMLPATLSWNVYSVLF